MLRRTFIISLLASGILPVFGTSRITSNAARKPRVRSQRDPKDAIHATPDPLHDWKRAHCTLISQSDQPLEKQILNAMQHNKTIRFKYSGGTVPGKIRELQPWMLFEVRGYPHRYVRGWEPALCDLRTFRLDKIQHLTSRHR